MTSKFDDKHDPSAQFQLQADSIPDDFELLSAYIDRELSPLETKQVQTRLDADPEFKKLYTQLRNLQSQLNHSVAPSSEKSVDEITAGVFRSIDRTRRRRHKLAWGGTAIAATFMATISGFVPFSPRMAEVKPGNSNLVMLAVAVDRPAINIPKSVTGYSPQNVFQQD